MSERSRRVSLKIEAIPNSLEAELLNYIKEDPISPTREVVLRALKAFYLPWALEGEMTEIELKHLAQNAVEELQFRIFQINQRYLMEDSGDHQRSQILGGIRNGSGSSFPASQAIATVSAPMEAFQKSINPADLDDF
jgi:hypothetical protein